MASLAGVVKAAMSSNRCVQQANLGWLSSRRGKVGNEDFKGGEERDSMAQVMNPWERGTR